MAGSCCPTPRSSGAPVSVAAGSLVAALLGARSTLLLGGMRGDDGVLSRTPVVSSLPVIHRTHMEPGVRAAKSNLKGKHLDAVAPALNCCRSASACGTYRFNAFSRSSVCVGKPRHAHSGRIMLPNPAFERSARQRRCRVPSSLRSSAPAQRCC